MTDPEPDAPEVDTGDRGGEYQGEWVRRAHVGPSHQCDTPTTYSNAQRMYLADASAGDVWRCGCGRLWVCFIRLPNADPRRGMIEAGGTRTPTWRRAGLWLRLRYSPLWDRVPPYMWVSAVITVLLMGALAVLSLLGVTPPP